MERKIGEIFEHKCKWYQCIKGDNCGECSLFNSICDTGIKMDDDDNVFDCCSRVRRSDGKSVIFKKLEKVGKPFTCNYYGDNRKIMMQEYKTYDININSTSGVLMYVTDEKHKRVAIAIKQNQEDMEEKKLNLKPFDLEAAKAGKPVCTRDGRKVRIVCYDLKAEHRRSYPLVALVEDNEEGEYIETYSEQGVAYGDVQGADNDLMMLPEKHEGWVNVYDTGKGHSVYQSKVYDTEEEAKKGLPVCTSFNMITVKLEWKE